MSKSITTTSCPSRTYCDDSAIAKLASIVEPMLQSQMMARHLVQPSWSSSMQQLMHQTNMCTNGSQPNRPWISTLTANQHLTPSLLSQTRFANDESSLQCTNNQMLMDHWETWRQIHQAAVNNNISPHFLALCQSSGYASDFPNSPRRKNATRETTSILKAWLNQHKKNPYPTKGEKIMLALITKMTLTQVSTWFANARRRLKKENKMTWTARTRNDDEADEHGDDEDEDVDNEDNSPISDSAFDDEPNIEMDKKPLLGGNESNEIHIGIETNKVPKIWSIADIANESLNSTNSKNKSTFISYPMSINALRCSTALSSYSDRLKLLKKISIPQLQNNMSSLSQLTYRNLMRPWSTVNLAGDSATWPTALNLTDNSQRIPQNSKSIFKEDASVVQSAIKLSNSRSPTTNISPVP